MSIPVEIAPIFERAIASVGLQRAAITLQGVIARFEPVQVINGELGEDTVKALAAVGRKIGFEEFARLYDKRLADRFGDLYREYQPSLPLEETAKPASRPKRSRRRK